MNATTATATKSRFSLSLFKKVKESGNGWEACCPAHDDTNPSLSIKHEGGKWLLHCHAKQCPVEEICAAIGIMASDLFDEGQAKPREVASYDYTDGDGKPLFQVVRLEPGFDGKKKSFLQRLPGAKSWGIGDTRRVLYRLPEVMAATEVLIVEGEKDVETARAWGFVATCNAMGAGKWREEYAGSLHGKRVTIIPDVDADGKGQEHAQRVAQSLQGKATRIKVIELPSVKDLSEWKAKGGTRAELLKLINDAAEWKEQPIPWRQAFKSIEEMEQGEIRFLIERILPEGVTFIGALPGVGKTWFALSLAKALTNGKPFLNIYSVPEPVNVLYLIPEAGERAFRKRLERMRISERLLCRTMKDGVMKLDDPLLLTAVRELKPVVFLDSAIRFNQADNENDAAQNATGLANDIFELVKVGAQGVVGLHHSPKSSAGQEMTLENMLRGTGDMGAMCDTAYGLQCVDSETVQLKVQCIKPRDFEPVRPFYIQGRPYIDEIGDFAVLVEPTSGESEVAKLDKAIRANSTASYRDLSRATGIILKRVAEVAAKAGWRKVGNQWIDATQQAPFKM